MVRLRGMFAGISGGYYEDETYLVADTCLDETGTIVLEAMVDGWDYYEGFNLFFSSFTSLINFMLLTYNNCQIMPFVYDSLSFCFGHGCDLFTFIVNVAANGPQFFYSVLQLGQNFANMLVYDKQEEIYQIWYVLGYSCGHLLRALFDINPNYSEDPWNTATDSLIYD